MLLVEGQSDALTALVDSRGFLVVGTPAHPEERPGKLVITILNINCSRYRSLPGVSANRHSGYRFKDFIRMGVPLDILLAVLALWLIPIFWPL